MIDLFKKNEFLWRRFSASATASEGAKVVRKCAQKGYWKYMVELLDIKNTRFRDETGCFLELLGRFELPTSSLPRMRSTY